MAQRRPRLGYRALGTDPQDNFSALAQFSG